MLIRFLLKNLILLGLIVFAVNALMNTSLSTLTRQINPLAEGDHTLIDDDMFISQEFLD